ncbi:MAG: Crp/Fnr family transcriptional regulator, partial [Dongiaceae bacterium]
NGDRVLPAGSQLYGVGEACAELYNLLDGWVALYRLVDSGRCQILDFALPGAFLGYQPDLAGPMLHGAQCLTDVTVCLFPRHRFADLLAKHPELTARLATLKAEELAVAHDHLTNVACRPARSRLANLLLELCSRVRRLDPQLEPHDVEIPLTQSNIADALGLSSVYVSITLKQLREEGLLVFKGGRLRIPDPVRLAEIADFADFPMGEVAETLSYRERAGTG